MAKLRRASIATFVAVLFVNAAAAAGLDADKISPEGRQFLDVVRTNFAAWNISRHGDLTREEIELDMQNPKIKGDAAAALAALKWGATGDQASQKARPYTLADFDAMEKTLADGKTLDKPYLAYFTAGQRKLRATQRELFADAVPHLAAIRQSLDSDCYFNSAVGSLAQASPQTIMKLIRTNPDGTFTVKFPDDAPVRVSAPTDSEIAAYTDASDGIWFNVLEKAFAVIRPIDMDLTTAEPLDAAALIPGDANFVLGLLSGHYTKITNFPLISNQSADARLLDQVRDDLASAFRDHRAVVAAKEHHAYAVVAFDPRTDAVTLHNPYGGNGEEAMPDGETAHSSAGFFSMSTDKFVENFKQMGVEQAPRPPIS